MRWDRKALASAFTSAWSPCVWVAGLGAVYGGSDYAVTAGGGDWTVHVVVGMDPDGKL